LRDALAATAHGASRLTLLIERGDLYQSAELSYSGGQREPHLVRVAGTPDLLASDRPVARAREALIRVRPVGEPRVVREIPRIETLIDVD